MEQWEIDYRKDLEDALSEGKYSIGESPNIIRTSKMGAIEYMVRQEKQKRILRDFYERNENKERDSEEYKKEFKEIADKIIKNQKDEHKNS